MSTSVSLHKRTDTNVMMLGTAVIFPADAGLNPDNKG
jgi:hypothetical protein